jgi:hypothetical protein
MTRKPTVPEVLPIVQRLYARHSAGCCWHIVLDDGNTEPSSTKWVIDEWLTKSDCNAPECRDLAELLPLMSTTQRDKLCRHPLKRALEQ